LSGFALSVGHGYGVIIVSVKLGAARQCERYIVIFDRLCNTDSLSVFVGNGHIICAADSTAATATAGTARRSTGAATARCLNGNSYLAVSVGVLCCSFII